MLGTLLSSFFCSGVVSVWWPRRGQPCKHPFFGWHGWRQTHTFSAGLLAFLLFHLFLHLFINHLTTWFFLSSPFLGKVSFFIHFTCHSKVFLLGVLHFYFTQISTRIGKTKGLLEKMPVLSSAFVLGQLCMFNFVWSQIRCQISIDLWSL